MQKKLQYSNELTTFEFSILWWLAPSHQPNLNHLHKKFWCMVKCVLYLCTSSSFYACNSRSGGREKNTSPNISESTKGVFHHQMGAFLLKLLRFSLSRVGNFSTSSFHGPLHPEQDEKERHRKIIVKKLQWIS